MLCRIQVSVCTPLGFRTPVSKNAESYASANEQLESDLETFQT